MATKPAPKPRYVKSGEALKVRNAYEKQRKADLAKNTQPTVIHDREDLIRRAK